MFDVGYSELLVIAIVLIVVVGPKDLPKMLRAFGKTMTKVRQVSGEFRKQFDDALKEADLDEVRKTISSARSLDPRQQIRDALNPLKTTMDELKRDVMTPKMAPGQIIPKISDLVAAPTESVVKPALAKPKSKAVALKKPVKAVEKAAKAATEASAAPAKPPVATVSAKAAVIAKKSAAAKKPVKGA